MCKKTLWSYIDLKKNLGRSKMHIDLKKNLAP